MAPVQRLDQLTSLGFINYINLLRYTEFFFTVLTICRTDTKHLLNPDIKMASESSILSFF